MVNLDEFKYGGTNVTAFRLLDPEREEVRKVVQDWIYGEMRFNRLGVDSGASGFKGVNQSMLKVIAKNT